MHFKLQVSLSEKYDKTEKCIKGIKTTFNRIRVSRSHQLQLPNALPLLVPNGIENYKNQIHFDVYQTYVLTN